MRRTKYNLTFFQAKLETKALKAKRPGFTDDRYSETSYYVENGKIIIVLFYTTSFAALIYHNVFLRTNRRSNENFISPQQRKATFTNEEPSWKVTATVFNEKNFFFLSPFRSKSQSNDVITSLL